ncbi:mucin-19-like isoform X2 [Polypterus senegalus]|uniref:mucin-19-like isoform X2 n=1 Tax=Polypterus senegalus TaxID=55291 RepID=UPI001964E3C5|nr:mucin-19-like isoform X2 [Polypterus senegalus]
MRYSLVLLLGVFLITGINSQSGNSEESDAGSGELSSTSSTGSTSQDVDFDECSAFGTGSYQTFQGTLYYLSSTCYLTLSRFQSPESTAEFNINIQRDQNGNFIKIMITVDKVDTEIENGTISVDGQSISLPYDQKTIHIHNYGIFTRLQSRRGFLSVFWETQGSIIDKVWVQLRKDYRGKTSGLCGNYNEDDHNIAELFQQSKLPGESDCITSNEPDPSSCQTETTCRNIISEYFVFYCIPAPKAVAYEKQCAVDSCSCADQTPCPALCAFFEEVVRQCPLERLTALYESIPRNWREETNCPTPSCPGDMIFTESGPAQPPTCSNPSPTDTKETISCQCPNGTILNDLEEQAQCVPIEQCPCEYHDVVYQSGESRESLCESCLCKSGKWECVRENCTSRCKIESGSFFTTFDGRSYTVNGICTYVIATSLDQMWTLTGTLDQCGQSICLTGVQLLFKSITYSFSSEKVGVGSKIITSNYKSDAVAISWQCSQYIYVQTSFAMKLQIQIAPVMQLYVMLPVEAKGLIKGLCGNYNDIVTDEFMASSGILEPTADSFAMSWATQSEQCENIYPECTRSDYAKYAEEHCAVLKDPLGLFAQCHSFVEYNNYYKQCITSTCLCDKPQECMCAALENYVKACSANGQNVTNWRGEECVPQCPSNQVFIYNMVSCNHTCQSLSEYDISCDVKSHPVDGCGCLNGQYMNDEGTCVSNIECPCYYKGKRLIPGKTQINGYECDCQYGALSCPEPVVVCEKNQVYVDCINPPSSQFYRTCSSVSISSVSFKCVSGCYCQDGFYMDNAGNCVPLDQCPCMFGGKVYNSGDSVQVDCNTCICMNASWSCTHNDCPGKCQVYGDGHYQTFDMKWYSFDGNCEYTFVEDYCGNLNGTFRITVESVPCCEEALTCSRAVKVTFKNTELVLRDLNLTEKTAGQNTISEGIINYSVETVGLYLIVTISNGITLIWDKHTRITVILKSQWRNKVCGLCGNFDGNSKNELQTRSNSVVANILEFGNSWKVESCSDVVNQTFPCEKHWYCSAWAQRRCSIIYQRTFQECHSKVDPQPYYDVCVQESCACEMEGRFLGFCTAVAAYAEACNEANVCVKWRTPDLCPVYCDYYNQPGGCSWHYEPCGTLPVKTCSGSSANMFYSSKLEGCYAKCPDDASYLDENTMTCTSLENCTCSYNGNLYPPGPVILTPSYISCTCIYGRMHCVENPSTTSTIITTEYSPTTTSAVTTTEYSPTTTSAVTTTENPSTTSTIITTEYSPTTTSAVTTTENPSTTSTIITTEYSPTTTSAVTTTEKPSTTSTIITTEFPCSGFWTSWINKFHPSLQNGGDFEKVEGLCPYNVSDIQCQSLHPSYHNQKVTCNIQQGLVCKNENQIPINDMSICADYEIRVCCSPFPSTTQPTSSPTSLPYLLLRLLPHLLLYLLPHLLLRLLPHLLPHLLLHLELALQETGHMLLVNHGMQTVPTTPALQVAQFSLYLSVVLQIQNQNVLKICLQN